ncbi:hypothetical protein KKC13_07240 [bacterium]|nr:hypothetical protein [bacterium]MBU1958929.1 hypothetical protein [bacterium]
MRKIKVVMLILFFFVNVGQNVYAYEEKLTLPSCSDKNSEVHFIDSDDDWLRINDLNKSIFCVKPADYSKLGRIVLTASGMAKKKRYILLDNGEDKHPSQLDKKMLAKVGFELQGAKYWVIDRMSYWDSNNAFIPNILSHSDENIFNRYFIYNVNGGAIVLHPDSDNNTIQNSRIERSDISLYMDRAAIELNNNGQDNISIKNNKIVNNEIVNFVDGIQLVKTGNSAQKFVNYEGTIIDSNHISIDSRIYTDCKGNPKTDGMCAYAENAIDLKAGSLNPQKPIMISNNKMWGFQKSDTSKSYLDDIGVAIPIHYDVANVVFEKNVVFNTRFAFVIDAPRDGYAAEKLEIRDNIFYNILSSAIFATDIDNMKIHDNLFKKIAYGEDGYGKGVFSAFYFNDSTNVSFYNNKIVHSFKSAEFYVKEEKYNGTPTDYYRFNNNTYFNANYASKNNSYEKSVAIVDKTSLLLTEAWENPTRHYKDLHIVTNRLNNEQSEIILPRVLQ